MDKIKVLYQENKKEIFFVMFMILVFLLLVFTIPFNKGPDELDRYKIAQYIFNHNELPNGTHPEVRIGQWGTSYAFSPFLSYMVSAVFMNIMSIFTTNSRMLLYAARMAEVVFSTITVIFTIKIANELFEKEDRWMFIVLVCTLPMFCFISAYINCDALALMSTAIVIYAWIIGLKNKWDRSSVLYLIVGLSICVLSYKNAYGYLLLSIFLYIFELYKADKQGRQKLLVIGSIVFFSVLVLAGWFYLRNYIIYDGDILGTKTNRALGELYARSDLKFSNRMTPYKQGYSITYMLFEMKWLEVTLRSFVGAFGYMEIWLNDIFYSLYKIYFLLGIIGILVYVFKNKKFYLKINVLNILFALSCLIVLALSIYYSYMSDFQPQGRYLLPMLIPLCYFVTKGLVTMLNCYLYKYKRTIVVIFTYCSIYCLVYTVYTYFISVYL